MGEYCRNKDFFKIQIEKLKEAINEDKYYLSQNSGYDVGFSVAEKDFRKNYLDEWAANFKKYFCLKMCEFRKNCTAKNLEFKCSSKSTPKPL